MEANSVPLADSHLCIRCGYELQGLVSTAVCPECGTPVERSLRGDLLRYSDDQYRDALYRGATFIMAGVVVSLIMMILGFMLGAFLGPARNISLLLNGAGLIGTALGLYGYYFYSTPDPGQLGSNKGESPRKVLRVAIWISAVCSVLAVPLQFLFDESSMAPSATNETILVGVMTFAISMISAIAWVVQFFAAMLYTKWLAPRIPSERILKRAKLLMWLGPLLLIFGCGIGGLIALILYYNMFGWIRASLVDIRNNVNTEPNPAGA